MGQNLIEKKFLTFSSCGFHQMAFTEWGGDRDHALLCLHGFTRNGRDFDILANALSNTHKVFCPDLVGRGRSDWLSNPLFYTLQTYLDHINSFMRQSPYQQFDLIGTSLGGILGFYLASQTPCPVRKLILNDVGAFTPQNAMSPIAHYTMQQQTFNNLQDLEIRLREIHKNWGFMSDEQWQHMAAHSYRINPQQKICFHYDPDIIYPMRFLPRSDINLFPLWKKITCDVMILHGTESQLLDDLILAEMLKTHPNTLIVDIPEVGHAPSLMEEGQISIIHEWLNS